MQYLTRRGKRAGYDRTGNVLWLTSWAQERDSLQVDPVASLKQNVTRLVGQVERSGRLKTDIAAALDARRYQVYGRSMTLGARASSRSLAAAERAHVGSLLRFLHAMAAAGSKGRWGGSESAARLDSLTESIRELETNLERARQLSQDMLAQCRNRDRREGPAGPAELTH